MKIAAGKSVCSALRRFTHLTNGFSKKVENHMHAVASHFMYYNFVKMHQTLKVTTATEAVLTKRHWDIYDLVAIIDVNEEPSQKRGPYKRRSFDCRLTFTPARDRF